ncbi:hypothetical protein ACQ4LE_009193 [Meloidogyne hapla]
MLRLHPILHAQLKKLLRELHLKFLKINSSKVDVAEASPNKKGTCPLSIDGNILIIEDKNELRNKHFEILKRTWSL